MDADDPTVTFTSDNPQVAEVSQNGLVTMTGGYGTAVITASARSGASASFTVNVVTVLPTQEPEETAIPENAAPYEDMYQQMYEESQPEATPVPDGHAVG